MASSTTIQDLLLRYEEEAVSGHEPDIARLCRNHPELMSTLKRRVALLEQMDWLEHQCLSIKSAQHSASVQIAEGTEPIPGYRLVRVLGQGGFGQIWQASGPGNLQVALKFVQLGGKEEQIELRAFSTIKDIRHPHLLSVLGIWTTATHIVIGMELADKSLADRLRTQREDGLQGLPQDEAQGYLREAALGLDALATIAHMQHRDVKPGNLLLVGGCVKVGDYGLVRLLQHATTQHTGNLTLAYAAPEFFDGRTSIHSDQYSLAVTYVELITGSLPYTGSAASIVCGHLFLEPDLSKVPERERYAIARALSKNPDARWPSCTAFYHAVLEGSSKQLQLPSRRRYLKWTAGAAVSAALASGAWWWKYRTKWEVVREFEWPAEMKRNNHFRYLVTDAYADWLLGNADYNVNDPTLNNGRPVIWDQRTGRIRKVLDVQGGPAIAFAPYTLEFRWFATGSDDGELLLWNTKSAEKEPTTFAGHLPPSSISSLAFNDNGKLLLTSATDNSVRLWDRLSGQEVKRLEGHTDYVLNALFAQGDRQIVSSSFDNSVRLWDARTGNCTKVLEGHKGQVWSLIVTHDNRAISGSKDGWVLVWDIVEGKELRRWNVGFWVQRLALSTNKRWLMITGDSHGRLMDIQTEQVLWEDKSPLFAFGLCWHPNEPDQLFASGEGQVKLVRVRG